MEFLESAFGLAVVYVVVAALICFGAVLLVRDEPTAHGQIVARQMGCLIGITWPLSIPFLLLTGLWLLLKFLWNKI